MTQPNCSFKKHMKRQGTQSKVTEDEGEDAGSYRMTFLNEETL